MKHIIVASHNEPLDWLKNCIPHWTEHFDTTLFVYTKGVVMTAYLKPGNLGYPFIRNKRLANEGREGNTYLAHLARYAQYLKDEDTMTFLQGNPFEHMPPDVDALRHPIPMPLQILNLHSIVPYKTFQGTIECDLNGKPHHNWNLDIKGALQRISSLMGDYQIMVPNWGDIIEFSPGAQFIVWGKSVNGVKSGFWHELNEWLLESEDNGFILERLWRYIFDAIWQRNGGSQVKNG